MTSLRERIADGIEQGIFRASLVADALQWRTHRSKSAISAVVRYAVEEDLADEVHDILTDDQFRELRLTRSDALDLWDDLSLGLEYFSSTRPDLLRYARLLFRQRSAERDDEYTLVHRHHCRAFGDFLQLDVPVTERRQIGLDRVLRRLFPMRLTVGGGDARPPVEIDLTGYHLGTWVCLCGAREGHAARYDFACGCGATSGNGLLSPDRRYCRCGTPATYATCGQCGTRVTLSLWWQIRRGGLHPSDCQIPLTLDLRIRRPGQPPTSSRIELMRLPLMLGLIERDDELVFDPPDWFWVDDVQDRHGDERRTGQIVAVADHPRYDRQTDVTRILEAAFRRTLTKRGHPAGSALETVVAVLAGIRRPGPNPRFSDRFSEQFARKVGRALAADQHEDAGLARGTDESRPCRVAVSPKLRGDAALVSRAVFAPGSLSGPGLDNVSVPLRIIRFGSDELTSEPPGVPSERCTALASDGIVLPGKMVEPGDLLIGITAPPEPENLTPEERLLRAIFGERPGRRDASVRWAGQYPARVLSVHISMAEHKDYKIVEHPARVIRHGKQHSEEEWARITISLATTQPLETGDLLYGPDGSRAVVCGTHDGRSADILVGPEHRWVNDNPTTIVEVRLRPDKRSRSVVQARSTGAYSMVKQLPISIREKDPGQPVRLADLAWLLRHGATQTSFEIYALRADCIDGRYELYKLLVAGRASLGEIPIVTVRDQTSLEAAPCEAIRNWDRLLRSACVEPVWQRDRLSFMALDDDEVLAASSGEVQRPDIVDPHTWLPEFGGLACQRIFGPIRDHTCGCGKRSVLMHNGEICQRCGVEVTVSRVRRQRMGHIELAAPMVHPWYRDNLSRALGIDREIVDDIIDGRRCVVRDGGTDHAVLLRAEADLALGADLVCTGAEAVRVLLDQRGQTPARGALLRRLPVLPTDLRPVIVINGRMSGSTLNDRYSNIIGRNSRLRRLTELGATPPEIHQAHVDLQRAVNALLDPREGRGSLADLATILPGRIGGFRQRLFDRPVDYSARSTLVAAPTGDLDMALLPDRLAWLLLEPVLMRRMVDAGNSTNVKAARRAVRDRTPRAWEHLRAACQDAMVLVSVSETRWPLFAVRVGLTAGLSLELDPALFEHLGWNRLGAHVRIFPLLTVESAAEARAALLPSALLRDNGPSVPTELPVSLLSLDQQHLPEEIARMIGTGESAHLSDLDRFLLFPGNCSVIPGDAAETGKNYRRS